jgi:hypothetical protein
MSGNYVDVLLALIETGLLQRAVPPESPESSRGPPEGPAGDGGLEPFPASRR